MRKIIQKLTIFAGAIIITSSALAFQQSPSRPPQFAASINSVARAAKLESTRVSRAIGKAESLIRNDYQREFERAMAMVCQGHCSPGITDSLNKMHAILDSALANTASAGQGVGAIAAALDDVVDQVNQAQTEVNGSRRR